MGRYMLGTSGHLDAVWALLRKNRQDRTLSAELVVADEAVKSDGGACAFEISMTFAESVEKVSGDKGIIITSTAKGLFLLVLPIIETT